MSLLLEGLLFSSPPLCSILLSPEVNGANSLKGTNSSLCSTLDIIGYRLSFPDPSSSSSSSSFSSSPDPEPLISLARRA